MADNAIVTTDLAAGLHWQNAPIRFAEAAQMPADDQFFFPTAANTQITDSVTQINTKVLGNTPAIAMGNLFQATAQALANAAHNATNYQQQSYVTMQASTTQGISTLYSVDTHSNGSAVAAIFA